MKNWKYFFEEIWKYFFVNNYLVFLNSEGKKYIKTSKDPVETEIWQGLSELINTHAEVSFLELWKKILDELIIYIGHWYSARAQSKVNEIAQMLDLENDFEI